MQASVMSGQRSIFDPPIARWVSLSDTLREQQPAAGTKRVNAAEGMQAHPVAEDLVHHLQQALHAQRLLQRRPHPLNLNRKAKMK